MSKVLLFIFYGLGTPQPISEYPDMDACKLAVELAETREHQSAGMLTDEKMFWRKSKAEYLCIPSGAK